jgi:hypothetical protein
MLRMLWTVLERHLNESSDLLALACLTVWAQLSVFET